MEQTALRPKPMPGGEPCGDRPSGPTRRPHAAPRRARQRLVTLLLALAACVALVLSGVGLGTMGATVIGMSRLAELRERAAGERGAATRPDDRARSGVPKSTPGQGSSPPPGTGAPTRPTLGVEAVDVPASASASAPEAAPAATPSAAPTSAGAAGRGALVVGVHVPGPGHAAGLVRGDTVLALGGTRTGSASDLARAVAAARPGVALKLLVRHANGTRQYLVAVPGVVT
ncbi:PDZ domain-containing protein [Streptomyces sp. AC495_CC817]|uniref:PDZ domain-containing protein n=1 Tax=Streptomyces sp. AC495_CC817 TaxID=2823900 RepID=UPI001C27AA20|nr:PDZ domain-containing protein [Streptomyces sp. AC495_CC817]